MLLRRVLSHGAALLESLLATCSGVAFSQLELLVLELLRAHWGPGDSGASAHLCPRESVAADSLLEPAAVSAAELRPAQELASVPVWLRPAWSARA